MSEACAAGEDGELGEEMLVDQSVMEDMGDNCTSLTLPLTQMNGEVNSGEGVRLSRQFSPDTEQVLVQSPFSKASETAQNEVMRDNQFYLSTTSIPQVRQKGFKGFMQRHGAMIKVFFVTCVVIGACATIMLIEEGHEESHMFVLKQHQKKFVDINPNLGCDYLHATFRGAFLDKYPMMTSHSLNGSHGVEASLCSVPSNMSASEMVNECKVLSPKNTIFFTASNHHNHLVNEFEHQFEVLRDKLEPGHELHIRMESTVDTDLALDLAILDVGKYGDVEVYVALIILLFMYVMIVTEMIHRTVAAMVAAVAGIAALNFFKEGPSLEKIVDWIDWETLLLLFGMMLMVTIFAESGFFDYCAILCCKLAGGRKWVLIFVLCFVSAFISAFLDNVTTVLLMTPVVIKICEAHNYDPINILIAIVLMSNVGGAATGIGDPPNVLIVNHSDMHKIGINFLVFTTHLSGGAIFCFVVGMMVLWLLYRNKDFSHQTSPAVQKLQHKIAMWEKYSKRIPTVSREETHIKNMISQHIVLLQCHLEEKMKSMKDNKASDWRVEVQKLQSASTVKDIPLMIKSICVLICVVALFFVQSASFIHADLGFIAFSGAIVLIVLADENDIETLIEKIEWTTLLFFGALFVLMEALAELHLLDFIGDRTVSLISHVDESVRFPFAIILVLWVSALSSSFIDNIPFTQAMIPIVYQLGKSDDDLPVYPLVWALAMGACLGGNGTLIGASANLVCAAAAQQKGYKITFNRFFKTGFPFMLATTLAASFYLIFFHYYPFKWNSVE